VLKHTLNRWKTHLNICYFDLIAKKYKKVLIHFHLNSHCCSHLENEKQAKKIALKNFYYLHFN